MIWSWASFWGVICNLRPQILGKLSGSICERNVCLYVTVMGPGRAAGSEGSVSVTLLGCTWPAGIPAPYVFDESLYLGAVQTTITCMTKTPHRRLSCHTAGTEWWKMFFFPFFFPRVINFFLFWLLILNDLKGWWPQISAWKAIVSTLMTKATKLKWEEGEEAESRRQDRGREVNGLIKRSGSRGLRVTHASPVCRLSQGQVCQVTNRTVDWRKRCFCQTLPLLITLPSFTYLVLFPLSPHPIGSHCAGWAAAFLRSLLELVFIQQQAEACTVSLGLFDKQMEVFMPPLWD